MTLLELHDYERIALGRMGHANEQPTSVRQCIALGALDRYHGMIEAMGRRHSPELWEAYNPLDRRKVL